MRFLSNQLTHGRFHTNTQSAVEVDEAAQDGAATQSPPLPPTLGVTGSHPASSSHDWQQPAAHTVHRWSVCSARETPEDVERKPAMQADGRGKPHTEVHRLWDPNPQPLSVLFSPSTHGDGPPSRRGGGSEPTAHSCQTDPPESKRLPVCFFLYEYLSIFFRLLGGWRLVVVCFHSQAPSSTHAHHTHSQTGTT